MNTEELTKRLEIKMKNALVRGDGVIYYVTCSELGLTEEGIADRQLFEIGAMISSRNTDKINIRKIKDEIDANFLESSKGLRIDNFCADTESKRKNLIRYSKKFDKGEEQDISDYLNVKIGALYCNVYRSIKKRLELK